MLHAAFLRSPLPHARILGIRVATALELPGVVAIFTGPHMVELTSPMSPAAAPPGFKAEPVYALAVDKTRFSGDPVAIVVAASRHIAEDACELIDVEYEQLRAIATFDQALDPEGPLVFDTLGSNVMLEVDQSFGDVEGAFADADVVVRETLAQHRVAQVPMECRGGVADFNPATGELTYYTGTQSPHGVRTFVSQSLGHPLERMRVLNGDIGGGFGLKISTHREDVAVCVAAKSLGRPVKWMEDRNEHLLASGQARQEKIDVEMAVKRDGTILGMKTRLILDGGAYPAIPFPGGGTVMTIMKMMPGSYAFRGYAASATVIASNKCPYSAYRGPWAMETFARERMINIVASELGLDPAHVRRINFAPNDGSLSMLTGSSLLGTSSAQSLERALELADYSRLREEQTEARAEGRYTGIGFATFIEAAPGPRGQGPVGREQARVRVEPDGHLTVYTKQAPHGQSHETTLAQIASDEMGIPMGNVRVVHGDTDTAPFSLVGTGGSRAGTMASGSVLQATRQVKQKVLAIAAEMLEVSPEDLDIVDGVLHPVGVPSVELDLAAVARKAYFAPGSVPAGIDTLLESTAIYDGGLGGWSGGTHLCLVEIDPTTGHVRILRYLVVEDCGRMVNPAIVEGQIRGGVAQGVGEVLYEWSAYDDEANFMAGTFMDYLLPTAKEIPVIEIDHLENEPNEEVSYRGVGEGGMLVAPAALVNGIEDALAPFGARITEQYLPPSRILELTKAVVTERLWHAT
jgi:carbon-monoxide dehydrogenase large subunit